VKQKIALQDKKLRTPINGKFNDTSSADLVTKYKRIILQNTKINFNKYYYRTLVYKLKKTQYIHLVIDSRLRSCIHFST